MKMKTKQFKALIRPLYRIANLLNELGIILNEIRNVERLKAHLDIHLGEKHNCGTCLFGLMHRGIDPIYGDCRKNPPIVIPKGATWETTEVFPQVESTAWCGRYREKTNA